MQHKVPLPMYPFDSSGSKLPNTPNFPPIYSNSHISITDTAQSQSEYNPSKCIPQKLQDMNFQIQIYDQGTTENLDLTTFKTKPCQILYNHKKKKCQFYHSVNDKRRDPCLYSSSRCEFYNTLSCTKGDSCTNAHNSVEELYHPQKFKTSLCNNFLAYNDCSYGQFCCFAHSPEELLLSTHKMEQSDSFAVNYFKTEKCPFHFKHNRLACSYYHNWQDFRRSPVAYKYEAVKCPNWDGNKMILKYEEGCANGMECKYCHGWKELMYHPHYYLNKLGDKSKLHGKK